jgi:mRNA interferase MazF
VICRQYDVVVVPFPFTDRRASKRRPALALSTAEFSAEAGHTVLAMITSADNPVWPLDVPIDPARAGLRAASKVRMKLFTLDNRMILRRVGCLHDVDRQAVAQAMTQLLGTIRS